MGKTDCFTQFYPILPNWFYPLGKTTMPTLALTPANKLVLDLPTSEGWKAELT